MKQIYARKMKELYHKKSGELGPTQGNNNPSVGLVVAEMMSQIRDSATGCRRNAR
jgi:hypothetical protein